METYADKQKKISDLETAFLIALCFAFLFLFAITYAIGRWHGYEYGRREIIVRGHAEYISNDHGVTVFRWKDDVVVENLDL
jgi:hypothetical protein